MLGLIQQRRGVLMTCLVAALTGAPVTFVPNGYDIELAAASAQPLPVRPCARARFCLPSKRPAACVQVGMCRLGVRVIADGCLAYACRQQALERMNRKVPLTVLGNPCGKGWRLGGDGKCYPLLH